MTSNKAVCDICIVLLSCWQQQVTHDQTGISEVLQTLTCNNLAYNAFKFTSPLIDGHFSTIGQVGLLLTC